MNSERDLDRLLAGLAPELDPVEHGFEAAPEAALPDGAFALITESDGVTRIGPGRGWARITLTVHSDLEAVGLTARVAAALAEHGIAANLVAGLHHDHLFVPWDRREEAMAALGALSAEAA